MNNLIPTSKIPELKYKFEYLNPFQSEFYPLHKEHKNVVCAAQTGAGKSVIAEMAIYNSVVNNGKRAIFLAPMRALAQEKYDDWTVEGHPFNEYGVSILTGDYKLTAKKKEELDRNKIIVMTSEMLDSRSRRMKSEGNKWLYEVTTLIVDESHIIGMSGDEDAIKARGHKLEAAIMRFTYYNKNSRIIMLSATLPNLPEIGQWLTKLNKLETITIVSNWRPQPLEWHLQIYPESTKWGSYFANQESMFQTGLDVISKNPEDMWLVFCHSKTVGRQFVSRLSQRFKTDIPFHCADLDKGDRIEIEQSFKNKNIKIMCATSTLAYGVNMPARRVLILGTKRGLNLVHPYDIRQMGGRAGRPGIDPRGDIHWIVGDGDMGFATKVITGIPEAKSQMFDIDVFAFHVVAEICEGDIKTRKDVYDYYTKCLACHQGAKVTEQWINKLVNTLIDMKSIKEEGDILTIAPLGKISSWMYFSPFDIFHWSENLRTVLDTRATGDWTIAWMIASTRSNAMSYIPKDIKNELYGLNAIRELPIRNCEAAILGIKLKLEGKDYKNIPSSCIPLVKNISFDIERIAQTLLLIDKMHLRKFAEKFIKKVAIRVSYGVGWEAADLCTLPRIGKSRANKLIASGIKSIADLKDNPKLGKKLLGESTYNTALGLNLSEEEMVLAVEAENIDFDAEIGE